MICVATEYQYDLSFERSLFPGCGDSRYMCDGCIALQAPDSPPDMKALAMHAGNETTQNDART